MQEQPAAKRINITDARQKMIEGVEIGYRAVSSSFGPRSANTAIKRPFGAPAVIHDGVNIFRSLFPFPDEEQGTGAEIAFNASEKTAAIGDGTTLATILTYEIAKEAHKRITAGARPMALREGIELATEAVLEQLDKLKAEIDVEKDADKLLMVASISAQVPDIGQMVADAYKELGRKGILTVEESTGTESILELKQGMQFDKGMISPYFIDQGNKHGEANLGDAKTPVRILVTDMHIRDLEDFHEMLQRIVEGGGIKQFAIIASGFEIPVASYFVKNHLAGAFKGVLIEAPAFGEKRQELLKDIAIVTGAEFISEGAGKGLASVMPDVLGTAKKLTSTHDTTLIVEGLGAKEDVTARIQEINGQLESTDLSAFDREKLNERLARLDSGIGILIMGAKSEPEMKERKERAIDAIAAAKAALSDGIVAGGGTALRLAAIKAKAAIKKSLAGADFDKVSGTEVIFAACQAPFKKLMSNAGYDAGYYLAKLEAKPEGWGVDVMDGQIIDMVKEGVIDPLLVISGAMGHASSAAVAIATTETLVTDLPRKASHGTDAGN
jgi:chaperonin GroEL